MISPLLANIGLYGLEKYIRTINPKVGIIIYADDFVVTAKEKKSLDRALILIKQWLSNRGLEISEEKTRIVHINDGFNFLGFNLRQYNGKLLIKPQKEKVLAFCKKIGKILSLMKASTQENVIKTLNPLLRGFANYYRSQVSKDVFSYINNRVWKYLWRWARRRHPNKGKRWIINNYFHSYKGNSWTFMCQGTDRKEKEINHILYDISRIPIVRHIKVKGTSSPDDSSLREYWQKRKQKGGKKYWAKGSKNEQVAKHQKWKCTVCGDALFNGEEIETHHIIPVSDGGSDSTDNLVHLHKACHKQVHSKPQLTA